MTRIIDLIRRKQDGEEITSEEFEHLVSGYTKGEIEDYQMASFLMAGSCNGFSETEATALTLAMAKCGRKLDLGDIEHPKVDGHSTGGVGDKISLIATPIAAAAGIAVPAVTGQAILYTGGTLDKLQAIPGFRTDLPLAEFRQIVVAHGLAFSGQTNDLAPADKKLSALRDVTGTADCPELIAASVMSKKLAAGLDGLVLDVKVGSGSLVRRRTDARRLAELMIAIGHRMDIRMQALLTDMNQPLGFTVGNALEVMEVSQTLQGQGPADLSGLSVEIAARMIYLGEPSSSLESARDQAQQLLTDGSAFAKLQAVIKAQGGDPNVLQQFELLPNANGEHIILSPRAGFVSRINADEIGRAAGLLGASRDAMGGNIDPAVGVILQSKIGDEVTEGSRLCALYYTDESHLEEGVQLVEDAFRISANPPEPIDLALDLVQ